MNVSGSSTCYSAMINVTVRVTNEIRAPQFEAKLTVKAQRQPLRYILLIAAGLDPRFRYSVLLSAVCVNGEVFILSYANSLSDVRNAVLDRFYLETMGFSNKMYSTVFILCYANSLSDITNAVLDLFDLEAMGFSNKMYR